MVVGETILSKYRSLLDKFADCVDEKNKVCEINKKKVDEIEMRLDQKYTGEIYFIMIFLERTTFDSRVRSDSVEVNNVIVTR